MNFFNRSRAQQGRQKVGVQLPMPVIPRAERRAMPAHRIRETAFKQVIVANQQPLQNRGQRFPLRSRQVWKTQDLALPRQEQRLERPDRPVGNQDEPVLVFEDDPFPLRQFFGGVVQQEWPAMLRRPRNAGSGPALLASVGKKVTCPNLPMRVPDSEQPITSPLFSKTCTPEIILSQFLQFLDSPIPPPPPVWPRVSIMANVQIMPGEKRAHPPGTFPGRPPRA